MTANQSFRFSLYNSNLGLGSNSQFNVFINGLPLKGFLGGVPYVHIPKYIMPETSDGRIANMFISVIGK